MNEDLRSQLSYMIDELYDIKLHSIASEKSTELKRLKTFIEILKSEKRELPRNEA
jgi:hypothetical protein